MFAPFHFHFTQTSVCKSFCYEVRVTSSLSSGRKHWIRIFLCYGLICREIHSVLYKQNLVLWPQNVEEYFLLGFLHWLTIDRIKMVENTKFYSNQVTHWARKCKNVNIYFLVQKTFLFWLIWIKIQELFTAYTLPFIADIITNIC